MEKADLPTPKINMDMTPTKLQDGREVILAFGGGRESLVEYKLELDSQPTADLLARKCMVVC